MRIVDRVCAFLEAMGARYALIGARALGIRGYPRMTVDYDLLTMDRRVLERGFWTELEQSGISVDPRRGDVDDPLGGVVRIGAGDSPEVDLVVGKWRWKGGVIDRAEPLDVGGLYLPVATRSDLVLLKLSAGGVIDLQDVMALLALGDREETIRQVDEHVEDLDRAAQRAWERLRGQEPDRA